MEKESKKENVLTDISGHWKVNTPQLLKEIIEHNDSTWALSRPVNIFQSILAELAARAIVLNDKKLNSLMLRLALYETANPSSKDFDPEFVTEYITKFGGKSK